MLGNHLTLFTDAIWCTSPKPMLFHLTYCVLSNRFTLQQRLRPYHQTEKWGVFEITASTLQGETLALFSIIIGLDHAMRKSLTGKEEDLGFTLTLRRYAGRPKKCFPISISRMISLSSQMRSSNLRNFCLVVRPSYLYDENPYTSKTAFLYWDGPRNRLTNNTQTSFIV